MWLYREKSFKNNSLERGEKAVSEAVAKKQKDVLPYNYAIVASVLREGKDNAITTKDIMNFTGIKDKRSIHEIIERLVVKYGYCIGSSRSGFKKGYYLISNKDELKDTLRTYNAQIQSMLKRHKALQENFVKMNEKGA